MKINLGGNNSGGFDNQSLEGPTSRITNPNMSSRMKLNT